MNNDTLFDDKPYATEDACKKQVEIVLGKLSEALNGVDNAACALKLAGFHNEALRVEGAADDLYSVGCEIALVHEIEGWEA